MAQERKQLDWRWVWLGAAVILVLVFFSIRSLTRERLQVRSVQVTRRPLDSVISTNGRVEPDVNYEVHSPVATTVKSIYVQAGDVVPAGKLLMLLDDTQTRARVATAESGVRAAQAALDAATHNGTLEQQQAAAADVARARLDRNQAQRDVEALVKLNATGAASNSEITAARQRLEVANANLEAAQTTSKGRYSPADLTRVRAALADAEANLAAAQQVEAQMSIRAPVAGTLYSLNVSRTDFVDEGKLLLQIADLEHERVRAYFDEPDLGSLSVGQPVQIKWDGRPGRIWTGHIDRVPVTVTTYGTRSVGEVLVSIDEGKGELLPDTNVTVTVTIFSQANALSVPREALHTENGKPFVFRIANNQLRRTPVTVGAMNMNQAAILSGLNPGDWVATGTLSGQPLQEGVPIKEIQ